MLEICKRLINEYGEEFCLRKVQEELKELDIAIDRYLNHGDDNRDNIIEEMADVRIQELKLKLIFNITEKELEEKTEKKLNKIQSYYLD